jgi:DtxR family Mn-dependent transcriptional regulator
MQVLSYTEENYLKGIFKLTIEMDDKTEAGTNEIASHLGVKPAIGKRYAEETEG